jgi:hypothetical protein
LWHSHPSLCLLFSSAFLLSFFVVFISHSFLFRFSYFDICLRLPFPSFVFFFVLFPALFLFPLRFMFHIVLACILSELRTFFLQGRTVTRQSNKLTRWSRLLLEKLTCAHFAKKFDVLYSPQAPVLKQMNAVCTPILFL